jgi:hypothetical protein
MFLLTIITIVLRLAEKRGQIFIRPSVSKGRNISLSRNLKDRKSIGRKGHIAESEPKGQSGPSLAALVSVHFDLLVIFLHLEFYKPESSNGGFEAHSRKINFDPLCNIWSFDFRPSVFEGLLILANFHVVCQWLELKK